MEAPCATALLSSERPCQVGLLAIEVYFPRTKVEQKDLEIFDGVPPGKYTTGLGQRSMAFTEDQEDVVSMSLTVVQSLLEKYSILPEEVGRLEVGTESSVDRSKSVKSFLMSLFSESGNSDVQGVDCINACYGGTAALFNAVNWVESSSWDGRYAIVVAADVAVYASGPARASGGCGAVAMLVGPGAPLVLEPGCSAAYMDNVYDFYKPAGIFPQVEGKLSIACYLTALDRCYARLCQKVERLRERNRLGGETQTSSSTFSLSDVDFCVMHAPFARMVRKGFARLVVHDRVRERRRLGPAAGQDARGPAPTSAAPAEQCPGGVGVVVLQADTQAPSGAALMPLDGSLPPSECAADRESRLAPLHRLLDEIGSEAACTEDKRVERAAMEASAPDFGRMAEPGMLLGLECGNMYAASVHASLASLVYSQGSALVGKRILAHSFGSGLAASIFCICGRAAEGRFSLHSMAEKLDLEARLALRKTASPSHFTAALNALEQAHGRPGHKPSSPAEDLLPGTFYLQEVDDRFRRKYCRKPLA